MPNIRQILLLFLSIQPLYIYAQDTYKILCNSVLMHYNEKRDTLAGKAARFILDNIKYHYFYDGKDLEQYYEEVDSISKNIRYPENIKAYQNINSSITQSDKTNTKVYDYECLKAEDLIRDIDDAIYNWKNGKWATHLSYKQFCEFLLPHKIGKEKPELNRQLYKDLFFPYTCRDAFSDERYDSPFWAAKNLCQGLKSKNYRLNDKAMPQIDIELPISTLYAMNMGACYHLAKLTTYLMRANGIPVALDFTPQWGKRGGNHTWNALLNANGKIIPFVGCDVMPGQEGHMGEYMPKVFRYTYKYQQESAYALGLKYGEAIPQIFDTPFIKDVTKEYQDGVNIDLKIKELTYLKKKIVYLAVFDDQNWQPVDYALIDEDGMAHFKDVGKGILYLPVFWGAKGSIPAGKPFYVKNNGELKFFKPDSSKICTCVLQRKYPLLWKYRDFAVKLKGGVIECSDSPNFKKSKMLLTINPIPESWKNNYAIKPDRSYKYYRFKAPTNSQCEIAEILYYNNDNLISNYNKLCDDFPRNKTRLLYADDNDLTTFYKSVHGRNAWIGAEFENRALVDSIIIVPRNDGNHVVKGHLYRLDYYDDERLIPIKTKIAKSDVICFENVPTNALLILHDLTSGYEERFFQLMTTIL